MINNHKNDPLHGVTLETIVRYLESYYGWEELGQRITINCFINNPSVKSSLTFLRKTPWARAKVEELYLFTTEIEENSSNFENYSKNKNEKA